MADVKPLRALNGADRDIDSFIETHYQRLAGLMFYRTGNRSVAEDLAQDALIKLLENWESVSVMDQPWAWLARVAINLSNSRYRRLKVVDRVENLLGAQRPESAPDAQDNTALLDVVKRMPKRQRDALLLRHYIGLNVKETAVAMSCAEGTVKGLTHSAIRTIRERLATDVEVEVDLRIVPWNGSLVGDTLEEGRNYA